MISASSRLLLSGPAWGPSPLQGSHFPDWLLQPRRRVEWAMVAAIAEAYLAGVSTRRVDGLVQAVGIEVLQPGWVRFGAGFASLACGRCRLGIAFKFVSE